MLLHASRASRVLTKTALLAKGVQLAGKGAWNAGKGLAGFAGRHWKGLGGTALAGSMVVPAVRKGTAGVSNEYIGGVNAGVLPSVPHA
jgi:hypothetical protein